MSDPPPVKSSATKKLLIRKSLSCHAGLGLLIGMVLALVATGWWLLQTTQQKQAEIWTLQSKIGSKEWELASASDRIDKLLAEDQRVRNDQLTATIAAIQSTYKQTVAVYEDTLQLREQKADTEKVESSLVTALTQLTEQNYASASDTLQIATADIKTLQQKLAAEAVVPTPQAPVSNTAPASGYARQQVETELGRYAISLVAADLASTRVIVDTASGGDCGNDCPVLPLADYVNRNGGFAGINGTYFCPATYPSCAGKTNTFDLLVMNKDKVYFNSDNNVYSNNPAVIFGGGYIRFLGAASEWGRDTGIDSMLSNYPLLVSGNQVRFNGDGDPKKGSKGNRSFVANKGNTVYIGVVHGATVAEAAVALQALGMDNALNLDSGGSTALWSGGYKTGPGRNIPNAIVFVRK